jgi:hypothetical protein
MKQLLGQTIYNVYMSEDNNVLVFTGFGIDHYAYNVSADCCSESWFESVTNPEYLHQEEVIGIEIKDLPNAEADEDAERDQECIQRYGYTLKTKKGYCDIEFRNASNGYYGGKCRFMKDTKLVSEGAEVYLEWGKQYSNPRELLKKLN